ncbi:hypothetical protein N7452_009097 [Penicillium brevicompactum]|uniref:Clr5 domain-containing protein n=2 Tax=Penicillium brevicompactum TaxID=5074 RepID=A0A9W9Q7M8_PENBR|nr:hypothetical protein N7452_009097 [Penicillium brevicompactum]
MNTYQPLSPPTHAHPPPPQPQAQSVFRPRRSDDWHEYREIIEQLYRNDQLKLRDVKRIMERDYKFFASEKQYKDRLAAWHVRKNIKAKEVHLMLRKQQKRAAQGKQTAFRVNGQNVDPKRIARFVRRYGTSWDSTRGKEQETEPQSPEPQTPSDMTCYTPEPADENSVTTPISPLEIHSPREMSSFPLNPYGKSTGSMSMRIPDIDGRYLTLDPNHLESLPDLIIDEDPNMPLAMHSNRNNYHSLGNGGHSHAHAHSHAQPLPNPVQANATVHAISHAVPQPHPHAHAHHAYVNHAHAHAHAHTGQTQRELDASADGDVHPPDWNTVESFQHRLRGLDDTLAQSMSKWAREHDPTQGDPRHEGLGM